MISIENTGTAAVKNLRIKKLRSGLPFMINARDLLPGQCYLEFPDGKIVLAALEGHSREFTILRELPENEAMMLRLNYGLSVSF